MEKTMDDEIEVGFIQGLTGTVTNIMVPCFLLGYSSEHLNISKLRWHVMIFRSLQLVSVPDLPA